MHKTSPIFALLNQQSHEQVQSAVKWPSGWKAGLSSAAIDSGSIPSRFKQELNQKHSQLPCFKLSIKGRVCGEQAGEFNC